MTDATRREQIVAAAMDVLEAGGSDALTMRAVAERLGIRAPSLYKHFRDKEALEAALITAGFEDSAVAFETAADGADDPLAAIAVAYRAWVRRRPHLYRLMTDRPLDRAALGPGSEARAAAPIVRAFAGDPAAARAAFAFAHGMASLEIVGRIPSDATTDRAWAAGIAGLRHLTRQGDQ
jgi:AcrR family transcriptional regulator